MNNTIFTPDAFKQYIEWQVEDRKTAKKISELILDIHRNGLMSGKGEPEKLKYSPDDYSRRITKEDRLIYKLDKENNLIIKSCKGHYEN